MHHRFGALTRRIIQISPPLEKKKSISKNTDYVFAGQQDAEIP